MHNYVHEINTIKIISYATHVNPSCFIQCLHVVYIPSAYNFLCFLKYFSIEILQYERMADEISYYILVKIQCSYCGGEPEHKHVANKCTCEERHAHNNGIINFTFTE